MWRHNLSQFGEMKAERLEAIRHHLYTKGFSSVPALSDAIGASPATIRRDLTLLAETGAISRVRGGAQISDVSAVELVFQERIHQNLAAKRAIASSAYEFLTPNTTIFLDAGTTVLQLARLIRVNPMPLRIWTNGLAVAQELLDTQHIEVSLLGGQLRNENASVVGPQAESMIQDIWFDQLYLGANAISPDGALYSVDAAEASLNRAMLSRSNLRLLLADSSKFDAVATFKVAPLSSTHVITDAGLSPQWRSHFCEKSVEHTIAESVAST